MDLSVLAIWWEMVDGGESSSLRSNVVIHVKIHSASDFKFQSIYSLTLLFSLSSHSSIDKAWSHFLVKNGSIKEVSVGSCTRATGGVNSLLFNLGGILEKHLLMTLYKICFAFNSSLRGWGFQTMPLLNLNKCQVKVFTLRNT